MKHWLRLALCGGALAALLTCGAAAADGVSTPDYTTANENCTVTYENGTYTAGYTGAQDGEQYALLVVKGTPEDYSISEDTIMYIDQKAADSSGVRSSPVTSTPLRYMCCRPSGPCLRSMSTVSRRPTTAWVSLQGTSRRRAYSPTVR